MKVENLLNASKLLIATLIISAYFLTLFLVDHYELDHFLIGFFGELLTIPFLLAQIVFLVLGFYLLLTQKHQRNLIVVSILILSICSLLTFGSIFR
ncbi:hypothetical protein ACXYMT_02640 [Salinimicrobium sp. CAU 1759]